MIHNRVVIVFIGLLIIGNIFFLSRYISVSEELRNMQATEAKVTLNQKVLDFSSMFIKEVLEANTQVDFNTRLSLENSVRALNDNEILTQWQNFTSAQTEVDAQNAVKKLLEILVSKIQK